MSIQKLILYRQFSESDQKLLSDMSYVVNHYYGKGEDAGEMAALFYESIHALIAMAGRYGLYGNLWHCFLTHLLINHENPFSRACERTGESPGSINEAALHDMEIFRELFDYPLETCASALKVDCVKLLLYYQSSESDKNIYNIRIRNRICELARKLSADETPFMMKQSLSAFYKSYGVGRFGLHKAFRIEGVPHTDRAEILPIPNIADVELSDLVGCESAKKKLIENTEAFLAGKPANNCLLYGDAGTGKSSSVKGILNRYYPEGLRIIEIYRHQFRYINDVIEQLKHRNYRFILYLDDLSFEEFETDYKYLKAVIEGGLEKKPDNVLIYATSNRRHLVKESFSDKNDRDEELHKSDTVEEKLSLAGRFGVTISFVSPDKKEFLQIVRVLAEREGLTLSEEELFLEAERWELSHSGRSGRTARQFIDHLLGVM